MLITKEVDVVINYNNYKHYQNLGYPIDIVVNKQGKRIIKRSVIKVKVSDLSKTSNVKVEICCNLCGLNKFVPYYRYCEHNHEGKTYCIHCAGKVFRSGENSHQWNPTLTQEERENGRRYPEYSQFVRRILARDKNVCYCCGKNNSNSEVHHLNGYNWCVEGRLDDSNAVTLCRNCHSNFHSIYGKGNNTKEQFEEWIGYAIEKIEKYNGILPSARKIFCIEQNKIYNSAIQIEHILHIPKSQIYAICNKKNSNKSANGLHFLWFDEYEKMTQEDICIYLEKCKSIHNRKIICITTNKVFEKITDGGKEYNISPRSIRYAINHYRGQKHAGKLDDGTQLEWMYYEDWYKLQQINYQEGRSAV